MGIFDLFKNKREDKKSLESKSVDIPHFGTINSNNLEEYYSCSFELGQNTINSDMNFEKTTISSKILDQISNVINDISEVNSNNIKSLKSEFDSGEGESCAYIDFFLEEFEESDLINLCGLTKNGSQYGSQLINKIKLIRVGFYPDGKFGASNFATFDYSIDIDGEPCNQLLVVNTDQNAKLLNITWES
jgi:hypothetical protein